MSASTLEVNHVHVFRNKKLVLQDISFTAYEGEIIAVMGPNGCGKSTLLHTLNRSLPYTSGSIQVQQIPLQQYSRKQLARQIAILPQTHMVPEAIQVRNLVRLGRFPYQRFYRGGTRKDEEWVNAALQAVQLTDKAMLPVAELSGGEQQRVWLAVLLAQEAKILLLDEPTVYLDMYHQLQLLQRLQTICTCFRLTILIVLHDINSALQYAQRILVMKAGKVVACGKPETTVTPALLASVFHIQSEVVRLKGGGSAIIPLSTDEN